MQFLTGAQVRAISEFRKKDLDYVVVSPTPGAVGSMTVTFWMINDEYVTFTISPEGALKYA